MIRLVAVTAFALAFATSAQAMSLVPLHQSDGMITKVRKPAVPAITWSMVLHSHCRSPERRQVCSWNAHSRWPVRQ